MSGRADEILSSLIGSRTIGPGQLGPGQLGPGQADRQNDQTHHSQSSPKPQKGGLVSRRAGEIKLSLNSSSIVKHLSPDRGPSGRTFKIELSVNSPMRAV